MKAQLSSTSSADLAARARIAVASARCALGVTHVHVVDVVVDRSRTAALPPPSVVLLGGNGIAIAWFADGSPFIVHPSLADLLASHGCILRDVRLAA